MENNKTFGKIRSVIFPIYKNELRKFFPLVAIFLLISLNYTLLRSLKDIYILDNASALVLYYLKLFGVIPSMMLFTVVYSKLSKVMGRDARFNIVVTYFLLFFIITFFFLLPNLQALQLNELAANLKVRFPRLAGMWEAVKYWPLSLFYIHAEAWGTIVLSVLLWTFINGITSVKQAKRFYSFLALGGAMGATGGGILIKAAQSQFNLLVGFVIVSTALALLLYNLFVLDMKKNPSCYQIEKKPAKKKMKLSFIDSLKFLIQSKYLALISVLVLAYGLVISLFECVWKDQVRELKKLSDNAGILADIYGNQGILVGILTAIIIIFFSTMIMKKGWRFAASVTPIIVLSLTLIFFTFLYFNDSLTGLASLLGTTTVLMTVMFGLLNVVLIKAFKYILFDPTKEAAYIPLDEESRIRGKAAVDGVGSRLGKGLGSIIVTVLSGIFGGAEIADIKYILFFIILFVIIAWLIAIKELSIHKQLAEAKLAQEQA